MSHQTIIRALILICCLVLPAVASAAGNISPTDRYAWSETAGWNKFATTGGGVTLYPDHLEGFAWFENIGWVKLGSHTGGGSVSYANSSNSDWGVNLNAGNLGGFAWSETSGWINFSPSGGGVTFDPVSGALDGYAWAENLGWLHFKGDAPAYNVRLNAVTLTVTLAGSGAGSVHSTPAGIACAPPGSGCSGSFFQEWPVTLAATPEWKSLFTGYSGGSTEATFPMDNYKSVTATFDLNYKARLMPGSDYASIQDAYNDAVSEDEIRVQTYFFQETEGLVLGRTAAKAITLKGGYSTDYINATSSGTTSGMTEVQGPVRIQGGRLAVQRLTIR
jgi:hypothetical protein